MLWFKRGLNICCIILKGTTKKFFLHLFKPHTIFAAMFINASDTNSKPWELNETADTITADNSMSLIVWNDEINTFEWVIKTLMEICQHTEDQAEQCALLIHFKGKYAVKQGDYNTLKPMCNAITERGINATIEEIKENA